ncbi:3-alpha,7-alpha,12-alpha-trihydroxy-5-beta-cholest-24-enoyl-CoA hydratase [Pseudonocardia sulfidoxydans NBRC 16205]|uniref:3-alpha,7-alpha,12-alpha-trihydroxy-5-beta-cholest-24-enoyl-CoA hydratase n=1 Tax=Pseudonocardia sulfidoxydans NBRC 16205 TaxID=1223511 RepID=A0A511DTJ2_9PSEU|nr:MaoC/PaaZ C-terminal domain-containing protein [Pseudonocardia sulfidoxydans]GEL27104.1 3-alpha,7-alpha,12-alpha-trihydroxy-5-beta-cholest-24-enoyl-CoA hydratase [Pseudonocardia sulfidoxydans NBRC 16205]
MTLNHELVGKRFGPGTRTWTADDAIVYALGVGAGHDPLDELALTTENTAGVAQRAFPTFATVLGVRDLVPPLGDYDGATLVHAEQSVELFAPLPVAGSAEVFRTVTGMYDKGKGALVVTESEGVDPATGDVLWRCGSSMYIRGEGGFGGASAPSGTWARPDGEPDHVVRFSTRPEQALLYRLCGDRNPLHSDPAFAARGGFAAPILHGLCTYGFAGRALVRSLCDGDPTRFGAMSARFSAVVLPGDELVVRVWADAPGEARFQVVRGDGTVVLDRGRFRTRERSTRCP